MSYTAIIMIKGTVEKFELWGWKLAICECFKFSDAIRGWAGCDLAHPKFGSSVNPITNMGGGADYAHHITACPPGFETLAASLKFATFGRVKKNVLSLTGLMAANLKHSKIISIQ